MTVFASATRRFALLLSVLLLAGCSSIGVVPSNEVIGTWSQAGPLQVSLGGSATVTLTFTSTNGQQATNFAVIQGSLPAGWTMLNDPVSCAVVTSTSNCISVLRFTPQAVGAGLLSIQYQYLDSNGKSRTNTAVLDYRGTSHDNVLATVTPPGQIVGILGGRQTVTVVFTTDDGAAASNLQLATPLTSLPAGWSSDQNSFSCATLSAGNGCTLVLNFAPTAAGAGKVVIGFSYADNSGQVRSAAVSIPYVVSNDNNVVATPAPSGQITGVVGGRSVAVTVGFTTDDSDAATNLQIVSGLGTLPAGWTGPASFQCASVDTGNGCQVNLSYSPTASASGSLVLQYQYTSAAGLQKTGSIVIPFVATTDNNVIATPAPSGQISAIVGGNRSVTVTFTTDDGNLASNLNITTDLSNLPAGWSIPGAASPPTFGCATLATGSSCQLSLLFAPTSVESGTLQLAFSYDANSGAAKTGTVALPYDSTAHNTLVATVSPGGQVTGEVGRGIQIATITFTSDDGNPVTNVAITSGLGTLPTDWTGPASFNCASVTTGTGCQLQLQFQPTVASSNGTVALAYNYQDNAGSAQTGTVSIPYTAVPVYLYVLAQSGNVLRCATSFTDGSVSGCISVASGFGTPYGLAFNGNQLYVADATGAVVDLCPVNVDGTLGSCANVAGAGVNPVTAPFALALYSGSIYIADGNGAAPFIYCQYAVDGTFDASDCSNTGAPPTPFNLTDGVAIATAGDALTYAYIVDSGGGNLTVCLIDPVDGGLDNCSQSPIGMTPGGLAVYNGNLYVGVGDDAEHIKRCPIAADGSVDVTACVQTAATATFSLPVGFAFNNGFAYISGYGGSGGVGGVFVCPVTVATGNLDTCTLSSDPLTQFQTLYGIAAH